MTDSMRREEDRAAVSKYYDVEPLEAGSGTDFRGILTFLRRRARLILGCAILGTVIGGLYGYTREPTYSATALLLLEPQSNPLTDLEALASGAAPNASYVETQLRLAKSPSFLERVVDRLKLVPEDPEELRRMAEAEAAAARARSGWIARFLPSDWLLATGLARDKPLPPLDELRQELMRARLEEFSKALRVRQEGRSLILSVSYSAEDPDEAARAANAVAELFLEQQSGDRIASLQASNEWLKQRLSELRDTIRSTENAIEEYRARHDLLQSQSIAPETEQAQTLTRMLVAARAERREKESRIRYVQSLVRRGESLNALSEVLESPYMQSLWEQERGLAMQEAELLSTYGPKHPTIMRLREEQRKLREQQQREIRRIIENLGNEVAVLRERERSIEADIAELMSKNNEAARAAIKLRELERELEANRKLHDQFAQKQKEIEAQVKLTKPNARIVARAEPPARPSTLPPPLFALLGFLGAGSFGLGLALLRERLDSGLRTAREIEALFGLPCFALVPELPAKMVRRFPSPAYYLAAKPLSVYAEAMRALATSLRASDIDHPPRIIQVTSSLPSEGKTTTVLSLATLLASEGHNVIAVDLDLRHPSLVRQLRPQPGAKPPRLVEHLMGSLPLEEAITHDPLLKIDLLPTQKSLTNPGAVIASRRLRDMLEELARIYDFVILDSTPTLGVTDARRLGELADAVLFLIRWEETDADVVEGALEEMAKGGGKVTGAALTMVDLVKLARYGYGGRDSYYNKYQRYYVD